MIKIYGVNLTQLPDRRALMSVLNNDLCSAWREHHRNIHDEHTARASLGGILLLQFAGLKKPFLYDENGRPYLESNMDFNITHTEQQVFCAIETPEESQGLQPSPMSNTTYPSKPVSRAYKKQCFVGKCRVGIDAENLNRLSHMRICPLAERWFSENEYDFFLSDPNDLSFLRVWTRKEALVKWTGTGLSTIREADTVLAEAMYGIRFFEYRVGDTVITLCAHSSALPPPSVHMLTSSEMMELL